MVNEMVNLARTRHDLRNYSRGPLRAGGGGRGAIPSGPIINPPSPLETATNKPFPCLTSFQFSTSVSEAYQNTHNTHLANSHLNINPLPIAPHKRHKYGYYTLVIIIIIRQHQAARSVMASTGNHTISGKSTLFRPFKGHLRPITLFAIVIVLLIMIGSTTIIANLILNGETRPLSDTISGLRGGNAIDHKLSSSRVVNISVAAIMFCPKNYNSSFQAKPRCGHGDLSRALPPVPCVACSALKR